MPMIFVFFFRALLGGKAGESGARPGEKDGVCVWGGGVEWGSRTEQRAESAYEIFQ